MFSEPLIITVAPNGAYKTKADHPHLPITPHELADTASACLEGGAAMLHLHVRDASGQHSLDAETYREAINAIHRAVGDRLIIQITTESAGIFDLEQQMATVYKLVPEAVSICLREFAANSVPHETISGFFSWIVKEGIMAQIIFYSPEDLRRWSDLRRDGVIPDARYFLLFVLGRYTQGQVSSPEDILPFLNEYDGKHLWSICAFGNFEHACAFAAASLGGHVRVGFENNLFLRDGTVAPDNGALVRQMVQGAHLLGRPLATAETVRKIFYQNPSPGRL